MQDELVVPRPPIRLTKYRCAICADQGESVVASWAWDPNTIGCVPICDGCRIISETFNEEVRIQPLLNQRVFHSFRVPV